MCLGWFLLTKALNKHAMHKAVIYQIAAAANNLRVPVNLRSCLILENCITKSLSNINLQANMSDLLGVEKIQKVGNEPVLTYNESAF